MITKGNIENVNIYPGKYLMIFSKILLCQNNYHINARDYNGIITEKNTYYPWSLPEFLANNNNTIMNEIIFHDNIDIKYCCRIITKTSLISTSLLKEQEQSLRNTQLEPDMSKLPFFCYPFEDIYTGINPLPPCSYAWYIMMSKMADIADGEGGSEGGEFGGGVLPEGAVDDEGVDVGIEAFVEVAGEGALPEDDEGEVGVEMGEDDVLHGLWGGLFEDEGDLLGADDLLALVGAAEGVDEGAGVWGGGIGEVEDEEGAAGVLGGDGFEQLHVSGEVGGTLGVDGEVDEG
jgi:hypothetical protein